jgi:protocatechuate 3,4-dioxygenase beta subunit
MRTHGIVLLLAIVWSSACSPTPTARPSEPVVGLPCEGCEAAFDGLPSAIGSTLRLGREDEPGEPLRLEGIVRDARGKAVPGVILYFYQTDATGLYPPGNGARTADGRLHGTLRGWLVTDDQGRYTLDTIRPGAYPNDIEPQHIHIHVIEPGRCTYFVDDVVFEDDPRLTPAMRRRSTSRGGLGITLPTKDTSGRWFVTRDITLGAAVPGYPPRP